MASFFEIMFPAAASRPTLAFALLLSLQMLGWAAPNVFLSRMPLNAGLSMMEGRALAEEVERLFGEGSAHGQLGHLEEALRPLYAALAKPGQAGLGNAASRYVLNRYFQQRHGWLVPGLDPLGGSWNASSPAVILEGRAPTYLQQIFEEHLEAGKMDLHAIAVFAATFEHLVRIETASRLENAYELLELPPEAALDEARLDGLLEMNMLVNLFADAHHGSPRVLHAIAANPEKAIPAWRDTQLFLHDVRRSVAFADRERTNPFLPRQYAFGEVLHTVEEYHNVFGHFQDKECQHLRNLLLPFEEHGTGRVKLSVFHGLARAGHAEFSERPEYLRHLGTLDESEPGRPKVIIANWLLSPGNCLGGSKYYNFCCVNECNKLMGQLEREIAAPRAPPQQVVSVVARLSSSTSLPRETSPR